MHTCRCTASVYTFSKNLEKWRDCASSFCQSCIWAWTETTEKIRHSEQNYSRCIHKSQAERSRKLWCLTFLSGSPLGVRPQPIFTQSGSNDVDSGKDVPNFAVKISLFIAPDLQGP